MLEFRDLTVSYGDGTPAVRNFTVSVREGEVVTLAGESGSGKSTVLHAAMGILPKRGKVTEGKILLDGENVLNWAERDWARVRGAKLALVPQDVGDTLDPVMKIGAQFTEYIRAHAAMNRREAEDLAREMLGRMRFPSAERVMNSYPFQLSGGQRQRVGIAMAQVFYPEFLLADEPTSALDAITQAEIVSQMLDLRKTSGAGILLVTHNLALAARISDRILILRDGTVVEEGTPDRILRHPENRYTRELIEAVPRLGGRHDG